MKKETFEQLCKELSGLSVFDHATFFEQLKTFTHERITKEIEVRNAEAKQLDEFVKAVILSK